MMKLYLFYVYILTNKYHNIMYTGVTNDLVRRCFEHKSRKIKGYTKKYNVDELVYYEKFDNVNDAIFREKQIKGYCRAKKIALVESLNKDWKNLYINGRIETLVLNTI